MASLPAIPPSRRATARKFPEEFSWWRASGWQMQAQDALDGRLLLHTMRQRGSSTRLWGTQAMAEEVTTPALIRHFLTVSLYLHLHPRKGRQHYEATGQVCSEVELAAFIRQLRRKAAQKPEILS